ncbi:MAG: zf-HC2 domain-containing protein [Thermoanaerobaculales bacterium]|jgi:predicted anti-sigma-YlaC factor YlaD|nr:zf-HC2 domain-containing protein [Thermoanaerobaculales bacterium]
MSCEVFRELLPAYLEDRLDEVRRAGFRAHLRSCAACREHAAAAEPTLLLSLARRCEPAPEAVEACVAAVVAGIRQERLERRLGPVWRPWFAAAAAVVLALVATFAWWLVRPAPGAGPALQAAAPAPAAEQPAGAETLRPGAEPPPRVEVEMTQDEVRVYQYAIGDDGSTGAVFIVNPGMEL